MIRRWWWIAILLALVLRLYGLKWGLPYFYAIDEQDVVGKAIGYVTTGDWSPHKFSHPASTLRYALGLVFQGTAWLRTALDHSFSRASFAAWAVEDPTFFYIVGRALTILCAVLTVCWTYRLGERTRNPRAGLYAALFLAASYLHVRLSLLATSDVPLTFFVTLIAWLALRMAERDESALYWGAGIALGAGLATKYPALLAGAPIVAAHLARRRQALAADPRANLPGRSGSAALALAGVALLAGAFFLRADSASAWLAGLIRAGEGMASLASRIAPLLRYALVAMGAFLAATGALVALGARAGRALWQVWRGLWDIRLWASFLLALLTFLLLTPYFLPELETALANIQAEFRADHVGANRLPGLANYAWYFREPMAWGYGWLLEALAALGLLSALRRPRRADLVLLAFMVPFFLVIANGSLRWARWIAPLLPFLMVYAGQGLERLVALLEGWASARRAPRWLWSALIPLLILAPILRSDVQAIRELNLEDTQTLATRWIEANVPQGARIVHEAYTARLLPTRYDVLEVDTLGRQSIAAYAREGYAYAVASSRMYDRYLGEAALYPAQAAAYHELFACGELLQEALPVEGTVQGPTVRVYALAGCGR